MLCNGSIVQELCLNFGTGSTAPGGGFHNPRLFFALLEFQNREGRKTLAKRHFSIENLPNKTLLYIRHHTSQNLVALTNGLPFQEQCSRHIQTKLLPDMKNPASMDEQVVCLLGPLLVALTCRSSLSYFRSLSCSDIHCSVQTTNQVEFNNLIIGVLHKH